MAQEMWKGIIVVDLKTDSESSGFAAAMRMAKAIAEIKKRNGNCLPQDLNEVGFTPEEVIEHWEKARSLMDVANKLESWEG
jgi:hypothetical protein